MAYLYAQKNPHRVSRLVCLDVGIGFGKETPWDYFLSFFYRIWLCCAYIISQTLSTFMGTTAFFFLFAIFKFIPILSPTAGKKKERVKRSFKEIHVNMAYPYYYLIKDQLTSKCPIVVQFPTMPFLYMYGNDKQVMFHNANFISRIESTSGCKHRGFDCGHWLQHEYPEEVAHEINQFVSLD
jgi:pimeloyl-ACP methyl ester carboxylesterase